MRKLDSSLELLDSELSGVARSAGVLRVVLGEGMEALAHAGGCAELGFATAEAHALERCGRSARWVQESRALARPRPPWNGGLDDVPTQS